LGRKPYTGELELSFFAVGDRHDTDVRITFSQSVDARGDEESIGICGFASLLKGVDLGGWGGHIYWGGRVRMRMSWGK
jgi:hypothetical protein